MEFQMSYLKSFKDDAVLNIPANLENSAVAIGLERVSFHSNPKEAQGQNVTTTAQLHLPHMLGKVILKIFKLGFNSMWNENFQMYKNKVSRSVVSDSLWPHGLDPTRLLCPWNSPGKNSGVSCHFLLQGTFPTQGSNPGHQHCNRLFTNWATREAPCHEKDLFFWLLVLEDLVGLHRTVQLQLLQRYWLGHRLGLL